MGLYIHPVNQNSNCESLEDTPSLFCSYDDILIIMDAKPFNGSLTLDDFGCCYDEKQLKWELDDCINYRDDILENIREDYDTEDTQYYMEILDQYVAVLQFAVDTGMGICWG